MVNLKNIILLNYNYKNYFERLSKMDNKLSHLTSEQLHNVMERYYNNESINSILNDYNIKCAPYHLYKYFPPLFMDNYSCEYCNTSLAMKRLSKSNTNKNRFESELFCIECNHSPYLENCICNKCKLSKVKLEHEKKLKQEDLKKKRKEEILKVYSLNSYKQLDYSDLTFKEKVYLGSVVRELLAEDLSVILPFCTAGRKIAPTDSLLSNMFKTLYDNNIIAVHPVYSDLDAFVKDDETLSERFYKYKVYYHLNLIIPPNKVTFIQQIISPDIYNKDLEEEAYKLWKVIATEECIEYLIHQINSVGFEFNAGDKTYATFNELLNSFSVSQIFGIIWKTVADASKLYLEKNISKKQAANSIIGACQRYGERAILNNWKLYEYQRIKDLPQSIVSEYFFNSVLKVGDIGFKLPPTHP